MKLGHAVLILAALGTGFYFWHSPQPAEPPAAPTQPGSVSADTFYLLALNQDGRVWRLGKPETGNLPLAKVPVPASLAGNWQYVSAGRTAAYAIGRDWQLSRWRFRDRSFAVDRGPSFDTWFEPVFGERTWQFVRQSRTHAIGMDQDGGLWLWGEADLDAQAQAVVPRPESALARVLPESPWQDACLQKDALYAIDRQGSLWTADRIAERPAGEALDLVPMAAPASLAKVFCGPNGSQMFVVDRTGTLWGQGTNHYGELGTGTLAAPPPGTWVKIGEGRWSDVAIGAGYTLALQRDGSLWAWGLNTSGQLGLGAETGNDNAPQRLPGNRVWLAIAAGHTTSAGITDNGKLLTWGSGYLGDGGVAASRIAPEPVEGGGMWGVNLAKGSL